VISKRIADSKLAIALINSIEANNEIAKVPINQMPDQETRKEEVQQQL
jgi:hypothetical protein